MKLFLFFFSVACSSFAFAEETKTPIAADVRMLLCHGPNDERSLEIVEKGAGCVLMYKKASGVSQVAKAQTSLEPCRNAMQKIRDRLESGNFACE